MVKIGEKVSLENKTYENPLVVQTLKEPTLELPKYISVEKKDKQVIGSLVELPGKGDIPFEQIYSEMLDRGYDTGAIPQGFGFNIVNFTNENSSEDHKITSSDKRLK